MNILQLVFSPSWGGLEITFGVYAKRFQDKGHNVFGIFSPNPKLEDLFKSIDIPYKIVKPVFRYLDIFTALKIKHLIAKKRIDIIQVYQSKDLSTSVLLKRLLKPTKLIFSQHMDSRHNKHDYFHKWIYKNIDRVICVTNDMKRNHLEHTPLDETKVEVIYNGVDLNRFNKEIIVDRNEFLGKNNIPTNKIIIGTIGRIDRLKNQEILIDIAEKLVKEQKKNIHFIIVGSETNTATGRNYKNELYNKINSHNLQNYFSIYEFSEQVEKYFSVIDIFVLTTTKESFGLVLLEAMAMSKPVIASNLGGPPEIIENGINGFLFAPENINDLISKVSILVSDEKLRKSFGERSLEIANSKFDLDHKVDDYLETFNNLIS